MPRRRPSVVDYYLKPPNLDLGKDLDTLRKLRPDLGKLIDAVQSSKAQLEHLKAQARGSFAIKEPRKFFRDVLGIVPTEGAKLAGYKEGLTPDQIQVVESVINNKLTAVPSGHSTGKTWLAARIALFMLETMEDTIVVTTAPTWTQVEKQLWGELAAAFQSSKVPLAGRLLSTEIKIGPKWYALGLSTDDPSRFQGFHSRRVVIIFDEATGVRDGLWDVAMSFVQGEQDRFLAIGNPTDPASRFKQVCDSGLWNVVRLDCRQHPNVLHGDPSIVPGAVTKEWVEERLIEYGGEDSPLFMARVCGLWPKQSTASLISVAWVEQAQQWKQKKQRSVTRSGTALGVDIGGFGSDLTTCWKIKDSLAELLWWTIHTDVMETTGRIVRTIDDLEGEASILCIDDTGIGNGVSMRLLEVQRMARDDLMKKANRHLPACAIRRINFSQSAENDDLYHRIKDEMWWLLRESLRKGIMGLPSSKDLLRLDPPLPRGSSMEQQLIVPFFELDSKGRIRVFDKNDGRNEKTKHLPTKSPDVAHGLMLAHFGWRKLRPEEFVERPKTWLELRQHQHAEEVRKIRKLERPQQPQGPEEYDYLNEW